MVHPLRPRSLPVLRILVVVVFIILSSLVHSVDAKYMPSWLTHGKKKKWISPGEAVGMYADALGWAGKKTEDAAASGAHAASASARSTLRAAIHASHISAVHAGLRRELAAAEAEVSTFAAEIVADLETALRNGFLARVEAVIAKATVDDAEVAVAQQAVEAATARFAASSAAADAAAVITALAAAEAKAEALVIFGLLQDVVDYFRSGSAEAKKVLLDALPDLLVVGLSAHLSTAVTAGQERVFDFRTREVGAFAYGTVYAEDPSKPAQKIGTGMAGAGVEAYVGIGWKRVDHALSLSSAYSGLFATVDAGVGVGVLAGVSTSGSYAVSASYSAASGLPEVHLDAVNTFSLGLSGGVSLITPPVSVNAGLPYYTYEEGGWSSGIGMPRSQCFSNSEEFIRAIWRGDLGAAATAESQALQIAMDALPGNLVVKLLQTALVYANQGRAVSGVCSLEHV